MWELLKEYWGSLLGAALALGMGITLALVAVYGAVRIYEANAVVLYLELGACVIIFVLEIERLIRDILIPRRGGYKNDSKG